MLVIGAEKISSWLACMVVLLASFTVQDFGVDGIRRVRRQDLDKRIELIRR